MIFRIHRDFDPDKLREISMVFAAARYRLDLYISTSGVDAHVLSAAQLFNQFHDGLTAAIPGLHLPAKFDLNDLTRQRESRVFYRAVWTT